MLFPREFIIPLLSAQPERAVELHQEQRDGAIQEIMDSLKRSGLNAV